MNTLPMEMASRTVSHAREDGASDPIPSDLRRLMQTLPLPCRVVNARGEVVWESNSLREILHTKADAGCCESLGFIHHEDSCPSLRTIRGNTPLKQNRWLGRIYLSMQTSPLPVVEGEERVSFEVFSDITTEKKLESAFAQQQELLETINKAMIEINHHLEAAQNELEEKNRNLEGANSQLRSLDQMKDEFISIVSHELKAPLTSIKGSVELIQSCERDTLSPTGVELLTICRRNTDRLHMLVQDLLDVARIESGRLSLGFTEFSVREMVEESLLSLQTLASHKPLRLENRIDPELMIEADRNRLIQVIVNLVNNAIKFTDEGTVSVQAQKDNSGIRFEVTDTGIGIPLESQTQIFDKFAQVGSTLHRNSGGTGLGLAIVRGIVREHGGAIVLRSEVSRGSSFSFMIPQPPGKVPHESAGPLD